MVHLKQDIEYQESLQDPEDDIVNEPQPVPLSILRLETMVRIKSRSDRDTAPDHCKDRVELHVQVHLNSLLKNPLALSPCC